MFSKTKHRYNKMRRNTRRRNTKRRNTKRIVGGDKEIINISKCYIEVYYGITFYKTPRQAIDFGAVEESKTLQNKYKILIEQLISETDTIEMRLGEQPFNSRLESLDPNICETTHFEGNLAKKEIAQIIEFMKNIYGINFICFLLCNEYNTVIGICCISLPLFTDDTTISIEYLCGSNYKYSGTVLLNIVKRFFSMGDFEKLTLVSYEKSVGFYLKNGFTQTIGRFNNPVMTITK